MPKRLVKWAFLTQRRLGHEGIARAWADGNHESHQERQIGLTADSRQRGNSIMESKVRPWRRRGALRLAKILAMVMLVVGLPLAVASPAAASG